jgi:hypothetical protein
VAPAITGPRALGGQDRVRRRFDRRRLGCRRSGRIGAERGIGVHCGLIDRVPLHIERQADVRRAGPSGRHVAERGAHRVGDLVGAIDHARPLGERTEQGGLVELGQDVASARADRDVGGHGEHRNRGFVGLDHARQEVGRAAAGWPFAHPDAAGDPGVGVGHVRGGALVAGQHVGDAVVEPVERIVQRQAGVAAQTEDVAHAVQLQHAHERLCPRQPIHCVLMLGPPKSSGDPVRPSSLCSSDLLALGRQPSSPLETSWKRARARSSEEVAGGLAEPHLNAPFRPGSRRAR